MREDVDGFLMHAGGSHLRLGGTKAGFTHGWSLLLRRPDRRGQRGEQVRRCLLDLSLCGRVVDRAGAVPRLVAVVPEVAMYGAWNDQVQGVGRQVCLRFVDIGRCRQSIGRRGDR